MKLSWGNSQEEGVDEETSEDTCQREDLPLAAHTKTLRLTLMGAKRAAASASAGIGRGWGARVARVGMIMLRAFEE